MLIDENGKQIERKILKNKKIIMYGASTRNQKAIEELQIKDNVLFFVDIDKKKEGQILGSYNIYSIEILKQFRDCIVLSVLVFQYKEILKELHKNSIKSCIFFYPEIFNITQVCENNRFVIQNKINFRYIHVFSNDKFVIPFYQMLEECFCIREHLFIVAYRIREDFANILSFSLKKCKRYNNVLILDDVHGIVKYNKEDMNRLITSELDCNSFLYCSSMENIFSSCEKIFLHSAFWGNETKKFLSYLVKKNYQKMAWICFGGDLNFAKESFEVSVVLSKINYSYFPKILLEKAKDNYGIKNGISIGLYYTYISENINLVKNYQRNDHINILLGHSAFEYNNHILGLNLLQKYKSKRIKIYCPLSYGSYEYGNYIINLGKNMYGENFIPLKQFMEQSKYYNFLKIIDIAVFPMTRLAAETTLLYLSTNGVKIYTNAEILNYLKIEDIIAEDILNINYQSFDEFIANTKVKHTMCNMNDKIVDGWSKVFNNVKEVKI